MYWICLTFSLGKWLKYLDDPPWLTTTWLKKAYTHTVYTNETVLQDLYYVIHAHAYTYASTVNPFGIGDGKVWISRCCLSNDIWLSFHTFHAKLLYQPDKCFPDPNKNVPQCRAGLGIIEYRKLEPTFVCIELRHASANFWRCAWSWTHLIRCLWEKTNPTLPGWHLWCPHDVCCCGFSWPSAIKMVGVGLHCYHIFLFVGAWNHEASGPGTEREGPRRINCKSHIIIHSHAAQTPPWHQSCTNTADLNLISHNLLSHETGRS